MFVTVIHGRPGRWGGRSSNVNVAVIRVVLIPRARHLSMHQSQSCVSRGEPTGINLEPESKSSCSTPTAKHRRRLHSHKHKLELNQSEAPGQHNTPSEPKNSNLLFYIIYFKYQPLMNLGGAHPNLNKWSAINVNHSRWLFKAWYEKTATYL